MATATAKRASKAEYEVHPVCRLMPEATAEEKQAIKTSIRQNGIEVPIVLFHGQVLDGRTRYELWRELTDEGHDIFLPTADYEGPETSIVDFVIDVNLHRRHLKSGQIAMLLAKALAYKAEHGGGDVDELEPDIAAASTSSGGGANGVPGNGKPSQAERKKLATAAGTSLRSVQRAEAIAKRDPAKLDDVLSGKTTLKQAERELKNPKPASEPAKLLDEIGGEIPKKLEGVFADRAKFNDAVNHINAAKKLLLDIGESPSGKYLPVERVISELKSATTAIKKSKPYAVVAGGGKDKCGWCTKLVFDQTKGGEGTDADSDGKPG